MDFNMDPDAEEKPHLEQQTPIGTKFGEQGERIRSARIRKQPKIDQEQPLLVNGNSAVKSEDEKEAEKHIIDDDDADDEQDDVW